MPLSPFETFSHVSICIFIAVVAVVVVAVVVVSI